MIVGEVYVFLWAIATGAILGLLFDFFRAFRFLGIRDIWVYIQDFFFWIIAAIIVIVSSFLINEGELRGYMIIGYLLGAGFYMLIFSKYILGLFRRIMKGLKKILSFIKNKVRQLINLSLKKKKVEVKQEI